MPDAEWAAQRRGAADALARAVARYPVVLLRGPDQVGKTTVARGALAGGAHGGGRYVDLAADETARLTAMADPARFVRELPAGTVIDDVHRVPPLLAALEEVARRSKQPGALLVVGSDAGLAQAARSTGPSRLPTVSISSLTRAELRGSIGRFIPAVFAGAPTHWPFEVLTTADYLDVALTGGFPHLQSDDAAGDRPTLVHHTVERLLAAVARPEADRLRDLFALVQGRPTARIVFDQDADRLLMTVSELTQRLDMLEAMGLVRLSAAWTRFRRRADSVRAYVRDPAFLNLQTLATPSRQPDQSLALRTLVAHELYVQNAWSRRPVDISFWRSKPSHDVDFLLEDRNGAVVAVAVCATATPDLFSFGGIDAFRRRHPRAYRRGVLLYPGDRIRSLSEDRWAVPLSVLWTLADEDAPLDVASLETELEAAVSELRVLVHRAPPAHPDLTAERAMIHAAMQRSLEPRLERIALVLGSLGLHVVAVGPASVPAGADDPPPPTWLPVLQAALIDAAAGNLASAPSEPVLLAVVTGLEINTADRSDTDSARWVAFVSAVLDNDAEGELAVSWMAGHALCSANPDGSHTASPTLVGVAGPLSCSLDRVEEAMVDQLCAALAATLPDALAALTPVA